MESDKIVLSGMVFYGYHGVLPEEKTLGQRFVVDLEVEADLHTAGISDTLSDAINYAEAYQTVKEIMEGPPKNLLESVAENVAQRVLSRFAITAVRVRVTKPSPPIPGAVMSGATIEVYRKR
jgi:dihydroneopterin aldolase